MGGWAIYAVVLILFVVTDNISIWLWSIKVNLRLLKAIVEFLWWGGGVGFEKSFSCPTQLLCCVVLSLGL